MNRNHLKIIACICMFCDHAGLLLFPQLTVLRWVGRLAMPLFAFFIGEGCLHTSNRKKYFLSLFVLGAGCQAVYIAQDLFINKRLTVSSDAWYFNILFTFCFAAAACFLLLDAKKTSAAGDRKRAVAAWGKFGCYFTAAAALTGVCYYLRRRGWSVYFDYGLCGVLLPLCAAAFTDKKRRLLAFSAALAVYCAVYCRSMPFVWFSFLSLPLLFVYDGQGGSKKLKYLFYVFYPAHLGLLYLLALLLR
ncbi:MAG: hypothetical protein IJT27_00940 [Clostridia bacterium]|nr:hypothetical protein [Clostridia bacterium]